MDAAQVKKALYELCKEYINSGIAASKEAIANARAAADEDEKSSAGDKFETAREMMQQEIDMNTSHINELQKLKVALDLVNPEQHSDTIQPGSLVHTNQGNYYMAVGIGKLQANDRAYYTISASAPLGAKLMGLKAGDAFAFNGKDFVINEVL